MIHALPERLGNTLDLLRQLGQRKRQKPVGAVVGNGSGEVETRCSMLCSAASS